MNSIFKLLGDENRYRIFTYLLKNGQTCVCDLQKLLDMKQANLSKHLMRMRQEGVVDSTKINRFVHYKISEEFTNNNKELISYIDRIEPECKLDNCNC
ncbi:metalloregulator ArsR/SmtB family transcription factor [Mycoplasmatota bacterium WC44]